MSKTFDLSTLNLSAGTHEITVKARASDYADSPASNAVSYVVAGDTVQVSGTWYFNEDLGTIQSTEFPTTAVNFTSNNIIYTKIGCDIGSVVYGNTYVYDIGWKDQNYRTITFDGTQTVSKEFYEWLTANAEDTRTKSRPLSGTWIFNAIPSIGKTTNYSENLDFISNGVSFENLYVTHNGYYIRCMPTNGEKGDELYIYDRDTGWLNSAYRTIAFVGTQYVSHAFYDWLVANAVRQTISFTIENAHDYDTTTYYADVGMTWAEWCDSEYNTRGGYIFNNTVMVWCYPTTEEYNSGLKDVVPTDVISNGGAYVATTDGPCVT